MAANRKTLALARKLFKASLVEGSLAPERVTGVLQWVGQTRPAHALALLRAYRRLVEAEIGRGEAIVECAGDVSPEGIRQIADAMARRYRRPVTAVAKPCPALVAGVRVRVGCDVYENSIVSQLAHLSETR
jgi:F-type H+-transporting ATPase subunit delta